MTQVVEIEQKIREFLTQELELSPGELTDTGNLVDDYGADSLSLITIAARIESELGVAIPASEWPEMTTLEEVFAAVHGRRADG